MEHWDFGDRPESTESFSEVDLKVEKPVNKNLQFTFRCDSTHICKAYNQAISEAVNREGLTFFHQAGGNAESEHVAGYHAWELWTDVRKEKLESLVKEIHIKARERFKTH